MKHALLATFALGGALALSACAEPAPVYSPFPAGGTTTSQPAPGGGQPVLYQQANGSTLVRYTNGCDVTYNRDGRRSGSQSCRPDQIDRADAAVQQQAASQRPVATAPAQVGGGMTFQKVQSGAAKITFKNGCVVTYNKDGRRSGSQGCNDKQVARADTAAQQNW